MYSLTLQLPVLFGLSFESSPATLFDDVQGLIGQTPLGRPRCISQTTLRHLQDFRLEVSPEFLRVVAIVVFAETFRKIPSVLPGQCSRPRDGGHPAEFR